MNNTPSSNEINKTSNLKGGSVHDNIEINERYLDEILQSKNS